MAAPILAAPTLAVLAVVVATVAGRAALAPGARAPDFDAQAALDGHQIAFSLARSRAEGPVVVYFYPAAFTHGCTIEAHEFAAAMPDFRRQGASVIGVSEDRIGVLQRFSVSACQGKFPVAADADGAIAGSYDARLAMRPALADRISYVVAPDGRILESYKSMNPDGHVEHALAALRAWNASRKS